MMSALLRSSTQYVSNGTDSRVTSLGRDEAPGLGTPERRLQAVFSALPAAVLVLDGGGRIVEANAAANALFDRPLIGETWRNVLRRDFGTRLDRGDLRAPDGRRFSVATHPLGDEPGQIVLLTDVSESRELQARLSHQERLASMGRMAATLAHQVRTPLATALLYASQLDNPQIDDYRRGRFVERLQDRLQHLEAMVRDLLMFARTGGFSCSIIKVSDLLESVADEIRERAIAHGGQVEIPARSNDELWGNGEALQAAFLNLAVNALQARPEGLHLEFRLRTDLPEVLEIEVIDNGPGMSPEACERVFEPFYTTRSDGTGLGLPVVRGIVEAHQGHISLRSDGHGCRFRVRLPKLGAEQRMDTADTGRTA